MLDTYLTETIGIRYRIGSNDCGEPLWSPAPPLPPASLRALTHTQTSFSRNDLGELKSINGTVLCQSPISPGDAVVFDDMLCPISSVTLVRDLNGDLLHYEAVIGGGGRTRQHGGLKITN